MPTSPPIFTVNSRKSDSPISSIHITTLQSGSGRVQSQGQTPGWGHGFITTQQASDPEVADNQDSFSFDPVVSNEQNFFFLFR